MRTVGGHRLASHARCAWPGVRRLACLLAVVVTAVALTGCRFAKERVTGFITEPRSIATADIDGNGTVDAVVGYPVASAWAATPVLQDRFGFWQRDEDAVAYVSELLAFTDLEGDGRPDLVAAGSNVVLTLANRDGRLVQEGDLYVLDGSTTALTAGTSLGGVRLVVVAFQQSGTSNIVSYEARDGRLVERQRFSRAGGAARVMALHDVSGDGRADLVVGTESGSIQIYRQTTTTGQFSTTPTTLTAPGHTAAVTALAVGDVATPDLPLLVSAPGWTVDGRPDILAAFDDGIEVVGWRGGESGTFSAGQPIMEREPSAARVVALVIEPGDTGAWAGVIRKDPASGSFPGLMVVDAREAAVPSIDIACEVIAAAPVPYSVQVIRSGVAMVCADGSVAIATPFINRVRVTTRQLDFGSQRVGTTSDPGTVQIGFPDEYVVTSASLAGPDAGDFTVRFEPNRCGMPNTPAWACVPHVEFTPRSRGAKRATLRISGGFVAAGTEPPTVELSGVAVGPVASVPASRSLGDVRVGATGPASVEVRNEGDAPLQVGAVGFDGPAAGWSAELGTCARPVAAGGACEVTVRFAPSAVGAVTARLSIESDSVESTPTVVLTARGVAPAVAVAPVAFGTVSVGSRAEQAVAITSSGSAPLTIDDVALVGPDADAFTLAGVDGCLAGALAPGGSCEVTVGVVPQRRGPLAAALRVESDALGGPVTVDVTAAGVKGALEAPATVDAGAIGVGAAAEVAVELRNVGDGLLTVASAESSGPVTVAEDGCSGRAVAVGETCAVTVRVAPLLAGPFVGELVVRHDGEGGEHRVAIVGTGTLLPIPGDDDPSGPGGRGPSEVPGGERPAGGGSGQPAPPTVDRGRLAIRVPARVALRRGRGTLRVVVRNVGGRAARGVTLRVRLPRGVRVISPTRARVARGVAVVWLGALRPARSRAVRLSLRATGRADRRARPVTVTVAGKGAPPARARTALHSR